MQVAFFPPSAATPNPGAGIPAEAGGSADETADTSFASLLDSNTGPASGESEQAADAGGGEGVAASPQSGHTTVEDDESAPAIAPELMIMDSAWPAPATEYPVFGIEPAPAPTEGAGVAAPSAPALPTETGPATAALPSLPSGGGGSPPASVGIEDEVTAEVGLAQPAPGAPPAARAAAAADVPAPGAVADEPIASASAASAGPRAAVPPETGTEAGARMAAPVELARAETLASSLQDEAGSIEREPKALQGKTAVIATAARMAARGEDSGTGAGTTAESAASTSRNPVAAVRTLTQVLGTNAPAAPAVGPTGPVSTPAAQTSAEALAGAPAADTPAVAGPGIKSGAEGEDSNSAGGRRERPEFLAGGKLREGGSAVATGLVAHGKKAVAVENQRVPGDAFSLGTGIAKEVQTMPAHPPVLPPSSAALDLVEPAVVGVSAGQSAASAAMKSPAELTALRSHAVELVHETMEQAERAQAAGRNHVELRLPGADGDLRVHFNWRDGALHTKFVTEDKDLEHALSREWEIAAPKLAARGLKLGETSFENREQSSQSGAQNASHFEQQRHSRGQGQPGSEQTPEFTLRPSALSRPTASARRTASPAAAAAVARGQSAPTETRGLRAWA